MTSLSYFLELNMLNSEAKILINKKLSYRKETVRLHDITNTSSSAVAEKKHCSVSFGWVMGDVHMKVSIHTASHIDTASRS